MVSEWYRIYEEWFDTNGSHTKGVEQFAFFRQNYIWRLAISIETKTPIFLDKYCVYSSEYLNKSVCPDDLRTERESDPNYSALCQLFNVDWCNNIPSFFSQLYQEIYGSLMDVVGTFYSGSTQPLDPLRIIPTPTTRRIVPIDDSKGT